MIMFEKYLPMVEQLAKKYQLDEDGKQDLYLYLLEGIHAQVDECVQKALQSKAKTLSEHAEHVTLSFEQSDLSDEGMCEERMLVLALMSDVEKMLDELSPAQGTTLMLRYGLLGEREHTLAETGKRLGCSRQAVYLMEQRALHKCKQILLRTSFLNRRG